MDYGHQGVGLLTDDVIADPSTLPDVGTGAAW
jgi:hypothetical protein